MKKNYFETFAKITRQMTVLFALVLGSSYASFAETDSQWGIGIVVGPSMPTGDVSMTRYANGLVASYRWTPKLDLSLALTNRFGNAGPVSNLLGLMLEFNYHFINDGVGPLYVGARAGAVSESSIGYGYYLGIGEQIGYDFAVANHLTFGPKGSFNYAFGTSTSTWVELLAQVKYWF